VIGAAARSERLEHRDLAALEADRRGREIQPPDARPLFADEGPGGRELAL
jgi:hypothetical protein